jgi:probable HAF family extracellular repeat protein
MAFLWSVSTGMVPLGTLPGATTSAAYAINNAGQVVGESSSTTGMHAFLWVEKKGMQDLGTLSGGDYSTAAAINNTGEVVGTSGSSLGTRAFLWDEAHGMQDLNGLISSNAGTVLAGALAINDAGQIVAYGNKSHGSPQHEVVQLDHASHVGSVHVYLLTP